MELDLRDLADRLILSHDPFGDGEDFEDFLAHYRHGLMILNIKSERIEQRVLDLVSRYRVKDYFLLDSSFPMVRMLSASGQRKIALRYSEFEGLDTIMNMQGAVDWVWVDCFTRMPLDRATYETLKGAGFRLCFVSPELQGQPEKNHEYISQIREQGIVFDAVCSKMTYMDAWVHYGLNSGKKQGIPGGG